MRRKQRFDLRLTLLDRRRYERRSIRWGMPTDPRRLMLEAYYCDELRVRWSVERDD